MHQDRDSTQNSPKQPRPVRFIDKDSIYHVTSRITGGLFLMKPDKKLEQYTLGLLAQASQLWPQVVVYGAAFLSNHLHLEAKGPCLEFSEFIGYLKREISRELGRRYRWRGSKFSVRFDATCLPAAADQERCLKYILSQGVKEDLVEKPQDWPGCHCAKYFIRSRPLKGYVIDGTAFAKVRHDEKRRCVPRHKRQDIDAFTTWVDFRFAPLPHLAHLSDSDYCALVRGWIREIVTEHRQRRRKTGKKVLGVKGIHKTCITDRVDPPITPWLERGRAMLVWCQEWTQAAQLYVKRYHLFQNAYREAVSVLHLKREVQFPAHCHPPPYWRSQAYEG